jgi:hypothetical protein
MRSTLTLAVLSVAIALPSASASAGVLSVDAGLEASATSWESDSAGFGTLRFGYGFSPRFAVYAEGKLGVGAVDERVVQTIDVGARLARPVGRLSPYLRAGIVHQHESPGDAVDRDPAATLGGWGNAIRHRAGASAAVGADVRLGRHRRGEFFASLELGTSLLVNEDGPAWYWGGGASFGMTFDLERRGGER